MFSEKYNKFKKTIHDYDIIPRDSKKIVIGMSGGKDAGVMGHFLLEYKKQERPDLEIEMLTSRLPYWEHLPESSFDMQLDDRQRELIHNQKKTTKEFVKYWAQFFICKDAPVQHELYKDRILNMNWPCMLCFGTKMKGMHQFFLEHDYEDNTLFAFGWTKWDAHYTLLSHFLKSDGTKWFDLKEKNPQKFKADCIFLGSFLTYPKVELGIPGKKIFRINPMLEFNDEETSALANEIGFPIVEDICRNFHGDIFDQDRRYLSKYIELFSKNQERLNLSSKSFLFSYRRLFKYLMDAGLIPPVDEIDGIIYKAYNSNFDEVYNLLKL